MEILKVSLLPVVDDHLQEVLHDQMILVVEIGNNRTEILFKNIFMLLH